MSIALAAAALFVSGTAAAAVESTDINLKIQANPASVVVGGTVVYTITVKNTSRAAASVQVFDSFPKELALINATSFPGGKCEVLGQVVRCDLDSLAPGSSACVRVLGLATAEGNAINTAAVVDSKDNETSVTATASVQIKPQQVAEKQTADLR